MFSDNNDFQSILTRLLDNVSDDLDKREGSIIYDALAPAAIELAQCYIALDIYKEQTNLLTATGSNLDNRVIECGLSRIAATPAQAIIKVYDNTDVLMDVPIGTRFAVPNEFGGYIFKLISKESEGTYIGECEEPGYDGSTYVGELLPIQNINNLGRAYIESIQMYGEDEEDDETLRARAIAKLNEESFAGNRAAYKEMAIGIKGIADCKVYPIWNGGGTVKLALIGPNHTLLNSTAVAEAQKEIDPGPQGTGVGMAPIGHTVTVVTPTEDSLTIAATLTLSSDTTVTQVKPAIVEQLQKYIYDVQSEFADKDVLVVYLAKVIAAILNVKEVLNVTNVMINNVAVDYEIDNSVPQDPTSHVIKYPTLTEAGVVLS